MSTARRMIESVVKGKFVERVLREEVDTQSSDELDLYIDNERRLYNQKQMCFKNLTIKKAQGKYNRDLAPKLFSYLVDLAAKMYAKEFDSPQNWNKIFDKETRNQLCQELVTEFEKKHEAGEFEEYVPKKYRGK